MCGESRDGRNAYRALRNIGNTSDISEVTDYG